MRQIPTSGDYCGECPCAAMNADFCFLYQESTEPVRGNRDEYRCPSCLSDRPMIITAKALEVIIQGARAEGAEDMRKDKRNGMV